MNKIDYDQIALSKARNSGMILSDIVENAMAENIIV